MKNRLLHIRYFLTLLTVASLFSLGTALAEAPQSQAPSQAAPQDNDTTRGELASFDRFMDGHPEIAEQLRRDPSLVKNEDFVRDHRDLQEYLQNHPGVREEISENPDRFMHQERRFDRSEDRRDQDRRDNDAAKDAAKPDQDRRDNDPAKPDQDRRDNDAARPDQDRRDNDATRPDQNRRDNDTTRGELASFDRFMDGHHEIAEQLRRDPTLVKNEDFVRNHPDLQEYLQQHPGVSEEISENPDRFMHQEQRFDRAEDQRGGDRRDNDANRLDNDTNRRDNDSNRGELANFDRFMDSHPEIAEQLRRDPSLARNREFVENHPALQEYLQQHPGVRDQMADDPGRFMHQEQQFDRREDRYRGRDNGDMADFGQFLGNHSSIAAELSKDPRLANDDQYRRTHPELQQYLNSHPGVQQQLKQDPQTFMKSAQPLGTSQAPLTKSPGVDPKTPSVDPMPKP